MAAACPTHAALITRRSFEKTLDWIDREEAAVRAKVEALGPRLH